MAVLVECISVLVTHSALEQRFPGGATAYQQSAPNSTYPSEGFLTQCDWLTLDLRTITALIFKSGMSRFETNCSRHNSSTFQRRANFVSQRCTSRPLKCVVVLDVLHFTNFCTTPFNCAI
jgi:hypothetical protein